MPRSFEELLIVLDVGKTMSGGSGLCRLEYAKAAISMLIQGKLLYTKNDEVCIITASSVMETKVIWELGKPSLKTIQLISSVNPTGTSSDYIGGLISGLMQLREHSVNDSNTRRCILITDAESPISNTNPAISLLKELNCTFEIFGVAFGLTSKSEEGQKNEILLHDLVEQVHGNVIPISQAMELLSECNRRTVRQTTKYRGSMAISNLLAINVFVYGKTAEDKLPSLKKLSIPSIEASVGEGKVKMDRVYHAIDDPDNEVEEEHRIKAYRYGKDYIPFNAQDDLNMKYVSQKEMKVLGFTSKDNIPRYCYMSSTDIAVAPPMDEYSQVGLSALIVACEETNKVIITRFIKRAKGDPSLCVLSPFIERNSEHEIIYEAFLINTLPFADDCRDYDFESLSTIPTTDKQLNAMQQLIETFDLTKVGPNQAEILSPDTTFNPTIQRFNKALQKKALDPTSSIPPLDSYVLRHYEVVNDIKKRNRDMFEEIKTLFPLEIVEHKKSKKDKYWNKDNETENIETIQLAGDTSTPTDNTIDDNIFQYTATTISTMNPVSDFNSMINSINHQLYKPACDGMKDVIFKFMNEGGLLYDRKAKECIKAFREGSIKINECATYNTHFKELKEKYENRITFWIDLKSQNCGLITNIDSQTSTISQEDNSQFWKWLEPKSGEPQQDTTLILDDEDSLLDDLL